MTAGKDELRGPSPIRDVLPGHHVRRPAGAEMLPSGTVRDVLVLAYAFPPLGGGGVHRTLSFVRHLLSHGWRATVISAGGDSGYWAMDETLLSRVPEEVRVLRVPEGPLGAGVRWIRRLVPRAVRPLFDRSVFFPDRYVSWVPNALLTALRISKSRDFDALYSTGGPWSDHLAALLVERLRGFPWVADFRDPWTQSSFFRAATPVHARAHRALERAVYERADRIVLNTASHLAMVERDFPSARSKAVHIPNGWEPEELEGLPAPEPGRMKRRIVYAGSFYPGRGPDRFYALLRRAIASSDRGDLQRRLTVDFYGKTEQQDAIPADLRDLITEHGYVSQREALEALARADATLVVMPEGERTGFVPGKLYNQLRIGRPILAVTPPGDTADLVREAGGGSLVLDPRDGDAVVRLARWLEALVEGELAPLDPRVAARFDRTKLAADLAAQLDQIAG